MNRRKLFKRIVTPDKLLLCIFLSGCVSLPVTELNQLAPVDCRAHGVLVDDEQLATGQIINGPVIRSTTLMRVERECGDYYPIGITGCAVPQGQEKYVIWDSFGKCGIRHEACHARYQIATHTTEYVIEWITGDIWAGCPVRSMVVKG